MLPVFFVWIYCQKTIFAPLQEILLLKKYNEAAG